MHGVEYPPVIQPEGRIKWKKDHANEQSGMKLGFCLSNTQSKNSAAPICTDCWHQVRQTPSVRNEAYLCIGKPSRSQSRFRQLADELDGKAEKAIETLENGLDDALAVMVLPGKYRRRLATTNMQERLNEEIRRRERVIRIFPNAAQPFG